MDLLLHGFATVLQPQIFFILVAGTLGGIIGPTVDDAAVTAAENAPG